MDNTTETDLTRLEGLPTSRADFSPLLEKVTLRGTLLGNTVEVTGEHLPGSAQSTANTAFLLMFAACLVTSTAYLIGVPAITALIVGLCAPVGTFTLIDVIYGRWTKKGTPPTRPQ